VDSQSHRECWTCSEDTVCTIAIVPSKSVNKERNSGY